jgi:nanoRNase/pAp phosphatase (c-di-AMP/oligoRNAs hydrolase)
MALRQLFMARAGVEPVIGFSGMIGRSENLVMAREMEIPLTPLGLIDPAEFAVIAMVDTQPGTGNNSLPPGVVVDIVIDHHPLRDATRQSRFVDVRDDYGVTATILYEYLLAQEVPVGDRLATALFYAIKSDTQDLGREANRPDQEAYLELFPRASTKLLYLITNPRQPVEYFRTMRRVLDRALLYGRCMVVEMGDVAFPELVAEMADFLLRLDQVDTVLSVGWYGCDLIFSIRTTDEEMNAGELARRLVSGVGSAGGHLHMAGGKVETDPLQADAVAELSALLTGRFLAETGCQGLVGAGI